MGSDCRLLHFHQMKLELLSQPTDVLLLTTTSRPCVDDGYQSMVEEANVSGVGVKALQNMIARVGISGRGVTVVRYILSPVTWQTQIENHRTDLFGRVAGETAY